MGMLGNVVTFTAPCPGCGRERVWRQSSVSGMEIQCACKVRQ